MNSKSHLLRIVTGLSLFVSGLWVVSPGSAQNTSFPTPKPLNNISTLINLRDSGRELSADDLKELDRLAEFLTFRVAVAPWNGEPESTKSSGVEKTMARLVFDVQDYIPRTNRPLQKGQITYSRELAKRIDQNLKEILSKPVKPIVRINAVRLMSVAAGLHYDGWVAAFKKMITSERESDAVRLYAFQGLKTVMGLTQPDDLTKPFIKDAKTQIELAELLETYITKAHPDAAANPEQIGVIQFVRREAISALGMLPQAIMREPGTEKILARPGLLLLKIAVGDPVLNPPASDMERIEALVGFLSMKIDPAVDAQVLTYMVNLSVIELVTIQGADRDRIRSGEQKGIKLQPAIPWKLSGARLEAAATNWKNSVAKSRINNIKLVDDLSALIIPGIFQKLATEGVNAPTQTNTLENWRTTRKPASAKPQLLTDDPTSAIAIR